MVKYSATRVAPAGMMLTNGAETNVTAVALLLVLFGSVAALDTLAVFEMVVPAGLAAATVIVKLAEPPFASKGVDHVTVFGPGLYMAPFVADTNVVPARKSITATLAASEGPKFDTPMV